MSGRTIAGDAHFFEDATTPAKVRAYLDSAKVNQKIFFILHFAVFSIALQFINGFNSIAGIGETEGYEMVTSDALKGA